MIGEVPGDDRFGNRGIGGCAVDQGSFRLQRQAKRDVRGFGADGSEHRPDFVVVNHSDGVVRSRAPDCGIFCDAASGGAAFCQLS